MALTDTYLQPNSFPRVDSSPHWGERELLIDFVGGPYQVSGLNSEQAQQLSHHFDHVSCPPTGESGDAALIKVMQVDPSVFRPLPPPPRPLSMDLEADAKAVRFASESLCGMIELTGERAGYLWTNATHTRFRNSDFQNFLRVFVTYRLASSGGMLIHSAGVVNRGMAYLFPGRSGDGKSTFSRLSLDHDRAVLSDDMNALTWSNGRPYLEKVPFTGDLGRTPTKSGRYPLAAILGLKKSEHTSIAPMPRSQALALLLASAPYLNADSHRTDYLLDRFSALLEYCPVHTMLFNTRDNPWPVIEQECGSPRQESAQQ